jgi:hypothetical protein
MVFAKSQQYTQVAQEAFPVPAYRKARTSSIWRILQSFSLFGSNILVLLVNLLVVIGMWNQVQGVKSYCPEIPYSMAYPETLVLLLRVLRLTAISRSSSSCHEKCGV